MRLILIEDEFTVGTNLVEQLTAANYEVDWERNGPDGLARAISGGHDLVLLDLGLPGIDGLEVARSLRKVLGHAPWILMLTARDSLEERLEGFEAGADDYVVKPFAVEEVLARVHALRARKSVASSPPSLVTVGDLVLDPARHRVTRAGRPVRINRLAFTLLQALMERSPAVLTHRECEEVLWDGFSPGGSVLRTHIYAIRRAIEQEEEASILHTVRGIGYRVGEAE